MRALYLQAIDQHRHRILSFAHYSLRVRENAEDVTQEVFIKLWQHWQKIDHEKLGAWLMRVAHNSVIDHVRKQRPQQANLDHYAEVEDQVGKESDANQFDQQHFKSQLQNAIKSLEDPFRSIVIMRDIQGMSYEEIQGSLELSASQVKVYLHRARRKLRENSKLRQLFEEQIADKSEAKQPIALVANTDKGSGHAQ
ncbi:MAG: sigma-70 family RNA polymerase sigma factor [Proteobacteria bacterium]|nr:sigma-70 family RNA polymerase sigma factor [Pseudomonadota bacterium]MDA1291938.1 sigma-70 family RNA polymerase sigma factor [Pseudomonadota bacterium]